MSTQLAWTIFLLKNNPNRMRKLLLRNFYTAVQEHFFIDLSKRLSDKTLSVLAEKSKVDINKVTILVRALESTEKSNKQALFSLHQQLREFLHNFRYLEPIQATKIRQVCSNLPTYYARSCCGHLRNHRAGEVICFIGLCNGCWNYILANWNLLYSCRRTDIEPTYLLY